MGSSPTPDSWSSRNAKSAFRAKLKRELGSHASSAARFSMEGAAGSATVKNLISPVYPGAS